jgi:hypothetical protein
MARLSIGVLSVLLAGCVSVGRPDLADERTMAQIKVGETTKQTVAGLLGEPDSLRVIEVGGGKREWWSYSYATAAINPLDYLLLYGFFFNGIGMYDTRYDAGVLFDQRGVVSSLSRTKTDYDMGRPFVSGQLTSVSQKIEGFPEARKEPIRFEDRWQAPLP